MRQLSSTPDALSFVQNTDVIMVDVEMTANPNVTENRRLALLVMGGLVVVPVLVLLVLLNKLSFARSSAVPPPHPGVESASLARDHQLDPSGEEVPPVQAAGSTPMAPKTIPRTLAPASTEMPSIPSILTEATAPATASTGVPVPTFTASWRPEPPPAPRSTASAALVVRVPGALPP